MAREYEYRFHDYDKKDVVKKMKALKAVKKGIFLFRVMVLIHPLESPNTYVRVRDEGERITMTYKYNTNDKFVNEDEVIVDNFDSACNILFGLGCKKKYYYEKTREIWKIKNTEIVFDMNPAIEEMMEIESKTIKELDYYTKKIGLDPNDNKTTDNAKIYLDLFGIIIPKNIDLDFKNMKKHLKPYVTKNMKQFNELTKVQLDIYKKIKNN